VMLSTSGDEYRLRLWRVWGQRPRSGLGITAGANFRREAFDAILMQLF
jgi:hypothetical protein